MMLVAMKGHPGSGKSTIARALGRALRWPIVDKDDIRDSSMELESLLFSCLPAHQASAASLLNSFSYDVMWRVVETQLQLGLSVIVDCPLSRPSLFQTAASFAKKYGARLVIVECVADDAQTWKSRLEARVPAGGGQVPPTSRQEEFQDSLANDEEHSHSNERITEKDRPTDANASRSTDGTGIECHDVPEVAGTATQGWHKPASWEELEKLVAGYNMCWDYDTSGAAKKLVVDTTSSCFQSIETAVLHWLQNLGDSTPAVSNFP